MSSTKPYLRMKAVLMMYKVFLKYPEALRPAFPRLKEKLEDPDPGECAFAFFHCIKSHEYHFQICRSTIGGRQRRVRTSP